MQEKYQSLIEVDEATLKKDSKTFTAVGWAKLTLVLLLGFFIYLISTREYPLPWVFMSAAAFIALVYFWIYHNKLEDRISYTKGQISICRRQIDRITGQWTAFKDTGEAFADAGHPYACDLDVVGRNSLFQMLNTTHTWHGRQAFADDLLSPEYKPADLHERQKAIAELSGNIEFSHRIQYFLSKIRPDPSLSDNLKQKTPFVKSNALQIFLTFAPVLTLAFNLAVVAFRLSSLYPMAAMILVLQLAAWIIGIRKTQKYLGSMAASLYKLGAYNDIIDTITGHGFACEKLRQIQGELRGAAQAVKKLTRIADRVSIKHNGLIYFLANVILLWDYECALWFAEWKQKYAHQSEGWFAALGEFESLLSFSHLPNICGQTCLPEILEKENTLQATDMGHPLLTNENRVSNDIAIDNNILIISGSNMSGKTTFLRTVGINLVLARAGGFVCAGKMELSLFNIVTSMRITDDLNEGVSTFYAELKRIKKIIDHAGPNMLFLIDEIFKGTNSADRLAGAKTVIAKLNDLGAACLLSTHDLELCEPANGGIKNYSFSEYYREGKICFDYKIRQGKSNTTNAKYLMEMVGIFE